jgi:hypothetical protein
VHACGRHRDIFATSQQFAKKPLGHRATTDIAGTDEKDVFHGRANADYARGGKLKPNCFKSIGATIPHQTNELFSGTTTIMNRLEAMFATLAKEAKLGA